MYAQNKRVFSSNVFCIAETLGIVAKVWQKKVCKKFDIINCLISVG